MSSMLVGYFSYDVIRYVEKVPDKCLDDLKIPDVRILRPKNLIIYDNLKKRFFILVIYLLTIKFQTILMNIIKLKKNLNY